MTWHFPLLGKNKIMDMPIRNIFLYLSSIYERFIICRGTWLITDKVPSPKNDHYINIKSYHYQKCSEISRQRTRHYFEAYHYEIIEFFWDWHFSDSLVQKAMSKWSRTKIILFPGSGAMFSLEVEKLILGQNLLSSSVTQKNDAGTHVTDLLRIFPLALDQPYYFFYSVFLWY